MSLRTDTWTCVVPNCKQQYRCKGYCQYHYRVLSLYKTNPQHKVTQKVCQRNSWLKRTYGITQKEWGIKVKEQNGLCWICHLKPQGVLHLDHCHKTGQVRKLLCRGCNIFIGKIENRQGTLERITNYEYLRIR